MKTNYFKISLAGIAMFASTCILMSSCTATKKVKSNGETLISMHCSDDEHLSDKEHIRSTGIGESMDQMTAKKKARSNAQSELAKTISSTMKIVGDNYVNSTEVNNKEELTETFQELSRTVVDQELQGAVKICEKFTKTDEGNYKCYMALELSGSDLLKKYNEALSSDDKLKADYNYEQFKEVFEQEMDALDKK